MNRSFRIARRLSPALVPVALLLAALFCAGTASAGAGRSIEGVWSFNGGAVSVVPEPNGTMSGFVVAPTKFAECVHEVGELMWIEMRLQQDGSYWGEHRWFYANSKCTPNPTFGATAWRVLQNPAGEYFLRVCFSAPGSNSQPTIAPNGAAGGVIYSCVNSQSLGHTTTATFPQTVKLPAAKACVARRTLTIKLRSPKYDPLEEVTVSVNGRKVVRLRGVKKLKKAIKLNHLPNGSYTVKVVAVTALHQRLIGSHRYTSCTKGSSNIKLHGSGKRKKHK